MVFLCELGGIHFNSVYYIPFSKLSAVERRNKPKLFTYYIKKNHTKFEEEGKPVIEMM